MTIPEFISYIRKFRKFRLHDKKLRLGNGTHRFIEGKIIFLLHNHLISIESILEQISFNLLLGQEGNAKIIAGALGYGGESSDDTNTIEWNQEKSLNSAILFTNALFDYIKILIALIYIDKETLDNLINKNEILVYIEKNNIHEGDWYLALFSILEKRFYSWYEISKDTIDNNVIDKFSSLRKTHKKFKETYQANILKHFGTTAFYRSDDTNILRNDFFNLDIETFFGSEKSWEMSNGSRGHTLDLTTARSAIKEDFKTKVDFILLLINQFE